MNRSTEEKIGPNDDYIIIKNVISYHNRKLLFIIILSSIAILCSKVNFLSSFFSIVIALALLPLKTTDILIEYLFSLISIQRGHLAKLLTKTHKLSLMTSKLRQCKNDKLVDNLQTFATIIMIANLLISMMQNNMLSAYIFFSTMLYSFAIIKRNITTLITCNLIAMLILKKFIEIIL